MYSRALAEYIAAHPPPQARLTREAHLAATARRQEENPSQTARPAFLITIDTEGDDLWSAPKEITTRNAAFLPRFQSLCERYGLKPTYLTNFEMATAPAYQTFARDAVRRGTAEIGTHIHAWNSPPIEPLTADDFSYQPYLIEYPPGVMRAKIEFLTNLLEHTFAVKMMSHRAGRWSFNARYARLLIDHGYTVDCSVTPHVSWHQMKGDPAQRGGTDFSRFPDIAYWMDGEDISRPGASPLLELPMTIVPSPARMARSVGRQLPEGSFVGRAWNRLFPPVLWLRPNGRNLRLMLQVLEHVRFQQRPYAELMLHSSELMPGGSPTFRTTESIERLYDHLEQLFSTVAIYFRGATLQEFHDQFLGASTSGWA
jgi:hypothetical protein